MASRAEEKQRRKEERLQKEQQRQDSAKRKKLITVVAVVVVILAAGAIAAFLIVKKGSEATGAEAGLQTTAAPWQPETKHLQERVDTLGFPPLGGEQYHVHSVLEVYVDGKKEPVPNNIGVDQATQYISPVHTHDDTGVVHVEAETKFTPTLEDIFTVWGVKFDDTQIGKYKAGGGNEIEAYVNGKKVSNPASYKIKADDRIVVSYGKPGSAPKKTSKDIPSDLKSDAVPSIG